MGELTNLQKLQIFRTGVQGSVPSELAKLSNLLHLYLFENALSGRVPGELAQLTRLIECRLQRRRAPAAAGSSEYEERNQFECPLPPLPSACSKRGSFAVTCAEPEL